MSLTSFSASTEYLQLIELWKRLQYKKCTIAEFCLLIWLDKIYIILIFNYCFKDIKKKYPQMCKKSFIARRLSWRRLHTRKRVSAKS
jgi:hypothetical protein